MLKEPKASVLSDGIRQRKGTMGHNSRNWTFE